MAIVNINTDAFVVQTNRLEKLHRSALPLAIRGTLNSAAFDVKTRTMPQTANASFINRNKTFFKANSRVEMAKGFDTKTMKATVGFLSGRLKGDSNFAVKDLQQQEHGGKIKSRSFIPTDVGRGGNKSKPVRPMNRLSKISNIVNSANVSGTTRKQKFIRAAIQAGKGGYVIGNFPNKKLHRITSIKKAGGGTVIKSKAIYTFKKGRDVSVKPTGFMRKATMNSTSKMPDIYNKEAKRQIQRLKK
jgi:hypothetical protein